MCRRRSIEFYKTYITNTIESENSNPIIGTHLRIPETTWEIHINSITQQCRDSIILECLLELLSDDVSCHEALQEGYVNLLWLSLKDTLENSQSFPIQEVNNFLITLQNYIYR